MLCKHYTILHFSDAIRCTFGPMIQHQLDLFKMEWNRHYLRHSSMTELPSGVPDVPDVLFHFPELKSIIL